MVGITAVYGAMVALDLSARGPADHEFGAGVKELALLPVWTAVLALWACAIWVTIDFWRCGESGRKDAVNRLLGFVGSASVGLLTVSPSTRFRVRAWTSDVLMACTSPGTAIATAYLATPVLIAAGATLFST